MDRIFKINNTWLGSDFDVKKLTYYLQRNHFPKNVIEKNIKEFLNKNSLMKRKKRKKNKEVHYFKLPYIGE